jgi:alpha-amylase
MRDETLLSYYRKLIALRRAHPALASGSFRELSTAGELLVFAREHEASGDAVVVAINRGKDVAVASVPLPELWRGRAPREALGGAPAPTHDGQLTVRVPPRSAQIYVPHTLTARRSHG